jgi:hypothetical protein
VSTPDREMAQPRVLEATLRKVTEGLAKELACPTQYAPDWSGFEWTVARAVAAMHGVSPLLSRTLRWQGPAGWVQSLAEQRAHTAKRRARIDGLLRLIDQAAREAGVAVVPLKGAALHGYIRIRSSSTAAARIEHLSIQGVSHDASAVTRGRVDGVQGHATPAAARHSSCPC